MLRLMEPERPSEPVIAYSAGNENNPGSYHGRVQLKLFADGRVELRNFKRLGEKHAWRARAAEGTLEKLLDALTAAGFPQLGKVPAPPPGSAMRNLSVASKGPPVSIPFDAVEVPK
jgi:hypothetical protein